MNQEITAPPPGDFKDRKVGLTIFGVLTMCAGGLCAIIVMVMFLAQSSKSANVPQSPPQAIFLVVVMYGGLALLLGVLGIGSILAQRWARALLLIFSWSWLLMGITAISFMVILMASPHYMASIQAVRPAGQPALPAAANMMIMLIPLVTLGIFFVIIPSVWIFFYGSKHVKATCDARNPTPGWTDRCPLPVLAISIWLALWGAMMLVFPLINHAVLPFFGIFLSGFKGSLAYVIVALVWGYSAWAIYNLRLHGWWLIFVAMCLFCISSIITYSRHDIMESYRLMGYPEQQIALLQKNNVFQGDRMLWVMLVSTLPWLAYLLWVRKFFVKKTVANS